MRIIDGNDFGFGTEDAGATNDSTANGNHSLILQQTETWFIVLLFIKHTLNHLT